MNPQLLIRAILLMHSFKKELHIVIWTFIFILALPLIGVTVITHTGINVVSDKLATISIQGREIDIHDPTGKVIAHIRIATTWPVLGVVTLRFGESDLPYQPFHTGIDIANPQGKVGDPVTPFMKGNVIYADEISWGYGKHVIIDHGNNITSLYGHLNEINVTKGQDVSPGDIIGHEGQTGWATGPHVHFEIRVFGIPVSPETFVEGQP